MNRALLPTALLLLGCQQAPSAPEPEPENLSSMVHIPAGPFMRGCRTELITMLGVKGCEDDPVDYPALDTPAREIHLSDYWIDRFEVTVGDYQSCIDAGGCTGSYAPSESDDLPVSGVTWYEAVAYCEWRGKRLPTEAQWEKAARGTDERGLPWGNERPTCGVVNSLISSIDCPDAPRRRVPVDQFPEDVSPYGVRGMAGNVQEWVHDWRELDYYETSPSVDPPGPEQVPDVALPRRVVRGSYHTGLVPGLNSTTRRGSPPGDAIERLGFRCASSTAPAED